VDPYERLSGDEHAVGRAVQADERVHLLACPGVGRAASPAEALVGAVVGKVAEAVAAPPAAGGRRVGEVVSRSEHGHGGAHSLDAAGRLVLEHGWQRTVLRTEVDGMGAMAYAERHHPDRHLVLSHAIQLYLSYD
jgi:hypothetical protein